MRGSTASAVVAAAAGSGWKLQRAKDSPTSGWSRRSAIGAEVLVTSCPYCITNFEDSRMNREDSDALEVKDITEIIQEVI